MAVTVTAIKAGSSRWALLAKDFDTNVSVLKC